MESVTFQGLYNVMRYYAIEHFLTFIHFQENCPQIKSTQKLKIPSGQQRTLKFEGKNLPQNDMNFEVILFNLIEIIKISSCYLKCGNLEYTAFVEVYLGAQSPIYLERK